jgi:azurin
LLRQGVGDAHPRVRMAVVNTVAHLRAEAAAGASAAGHSQREGHLKAGSPGDLEKVLEGMKSEEAAVKQMLQDLQAGVKPKRGRAVPVLEIKPETEVTRWEPVGEGDAGGKNAPATAKKGSKSGNVAATFRTFVESPEAQTVLLSVKHGFLDVSANGVQLLSADNQWSSQQQIQVDLQKGVNLIEMAFRKLKSETSRPPVFLFDTLGAPISGKVPKQEAEFKSLAAAWDEAHAADRNALKVIAVPNQLQFSPKELRVKAGAPVRVIFENPDLMQHNWVLVERGADEEVGVLADQMAVKPDGMQKSFIPETPKVLRATALVNPSGRAELQFEAPKEPGNYPFLCTFPGHWRIMRGTLIVE